MFLGVRGENGSEELGPVRHRSFRDGDHHFPVIGVEAGQEEFRPDRTDLFGREIDDPDDLPADEVVLAVEGRDLGAGFPDP